MKWKKLIKRGSAAVAIISGVLLFSCANRDDPGDSSNIMQGKVSSPNVSGRWVGTASTSHMPLTQIEFNISQSGGSASGTFDFSDAGKGTLNGNIENKEFTFVCIKSDTACPGEFRGIATVGEDRMTFSLIGSDCKGTHKNGSGVVDRQ